MNTSISESREILQKSQGSRIAFKDEDIRAERNREAQISNLKVVKKQMVENFKKKKDSNAGRNSSVASITNMDGNVVQFGSSTKKRLINRRAPE